MVVELRLVAAPATETPVHLKFGGDPQSLPPSVVQLRFKAPATSGTPVHLVFGDDSGYVPPAVDATLTLASAVAVLSASDISSALPANIEASYTSDTARPLVGQVRQRWQDGTRAQSANRSQWTNSQPYRSGAEIRYQEGIRLQSSAGFAWEDTDRLHLSAEVRYQEGVRLATAIKEFRFQEAIRVRSGPRVRHQEGERTSLVPVFIRFQDGYRDRRNWAAVRFQDGVPVSNPVTTFEQRGDAMWQLWRARYQEGMPVPPGKWVKPPTPEPNDPCYIPNTHLVFKDPRATNASLVFICERHGGPGPEPGATVVVPVKNVYMVLNEATLTRVDGSVPIPTYSMSMSLDVDSWTWSFSASVPALALGDLEPSSYGEPVEVQASINGVPYRFLVETIGRDRGFADSRLRISGRGKSALLDNPYSAQMVFGNEFNRTAQQLMGDVLTLNGVPLDWDIQWEIDDWNVPAGVFSHTGSYMSALLQIAGAPGAYIQPHATAQTLYVKPRFPDLPSKWGDLTPDIELPSAGVTRESIEWRNLPAYSRVFVSGTSEGVVGQVTLAGTDGSLVAPMVTDPLITEGVAARQRGLAVLSETGRQVPFNLRMPIFPETGIIPPGKLVRYVDNGVPRLGITRSVQVEVGLPAIWQTVALESYE